MLHLFTLCESKRYDIGGAPLVPLIYALMGQHRLSYSTSCATGARTCNSLRPTCASFALLCPNKPRRKPNRSFVGHHGMDTRLCAPFMVPFGLSHHAPGRWAARETINNILHLLKPCQPLLEAILDTAESLCAGLSRTW